jgi:hypothetical protein
MHGMVPATLVLIVTPVILVVAAIWWHLHDRRAERKTGHPPAPPTPASRDPYR